MTLIGQIKADKSKNLRRKIRKNPLHPRYPRSIFGTAEYGWSELIFADSYGSSGSHLVVTNATG